MQKLLVAAVAVLLMAVAGLGSYIAFGQGGTAGAQSPIDCTLDLDDSTTPATGTVTCSGTITVDTPIGEKTLEFNLVVSFVDLPPEGPSFGDDVVSCSLEIDGTPVDLSGVGPCPDDGPSPPPPPGR